MSESLPPRLAIVLSHPTQYYSPWFRWLAAQGHLTVRVFYLWDFGVTARHDPGFGATFKWDVDLLSGYEHEFVPNAARDPGTHHFRGLNNPTLKLRLAAWGPDAVLLFGYKFLTHLRLILRSPWPLIFRGDSHLLGQPSPAWLKKILLTRLYARFAAITYVGQANRAYFRAFGVPESKLFFAPHCVDQAHFTPTAELRAAAARLRDQLGLTGHRIVLFAGKLVPAKQPRALLKAFLQIQSPGTALVFVGEGEERSALTALAAQHSTAAVRFLPFANQSEMPVRYLLADIFVLPSRGFYETWGLAVNEAMHLGVPCLVSDRVGCQQDLVTDGETGWVFRADSADQLRGALGRALADTSAQADRLSRQASARAAGYSYAAAAAGLEAAVAGTRPSP
jgi:glycosyltransferase involved in cell wall biosynthesis